MKHYIENDCLSETNPLMGILYIWRVVLLKLKHHIFHRKHPLPYKKPCEFASKCVCEICRMSKKIICDRFCVLGRNLSNMDPNNNSCINNVICCVCYVHFIISIPFCVQNSVEKIRNLRFMANLQRKKY